MLAKNKTNDERLFQLKKQEKGIMREDIYVCLEGLFLPPFIYFILLYIKNGQFRWVVGSCLNVCNSKETGATTEAKRHSCKSLDNLSDRNLPKCMQLIARLILTLSSKQERRRRNLQTLSAHSVQKRKVKKIKCKRRQSEITGSKDTKEKHVSHSAWKKYDL